MSQPATGIPSAPALLLEAGVSGALNLTESQIASIRALLNNCDPLISGLADYQCSALSTADQNRLWSEALDMLSQAQIERLRQISYQAIPLLQLENPATWQLLGLSGDQTTQLEARMRENDRQNEKMLQDLSRIRFRSPEDMERFVSDEKSDAVARLTSVLDHEQLQLFELQKGAPLEAFEPR